MHAFKNCGQASLMLAKLNSSQFYIQVYSLKCQISEAFYFEMQHLIPMKVLWLDT